ncbi:MAG: hypothetical protein ACK5LM_03115 [Lactovum sp.]
MEWLESYRVLKINGLTKKVLLEVDPDDRFYKKYDLNLFDENVREGCQVYKYKNIDEQEEFIFITEIMEKEGR